MSVGERFCNYRDGREMSVADAYGVKGPGGKFVRRSIFVIDPEGVIRYRKVALVGLGYENAGDLAEALAEARAAAPV